MGASAAVGLQPSFWASIVIAGRDGKEKKKRQMDTSGNQA